MSAEQTSLRSTIKKLRTIVRGVEVENPDTIRLLRQMERLSIQIERKYRNKRKAPTGVGSPALSSAASVGFASNYAPVIVNNSASVVAIN